MIGDLPDLIAKRAALSPDAVALEDAASGRSLTYEALDARAGRAAALMAAKGVGGGDRVAALTRNRIEFFELLFGCAKLGAVLVPLNWRMPPAELDGLIADAEPALLFHGAVEAAAARARLRRRRRRWISTAITKPCSARRRPAAGARAGRRPRPGT
jgi:fatty-acyl-CoA synthase